MSSTIKIICLFFLLKYVYVFSFEPEVFPALIYRMVKPRAVFLMFVNGKIVLTGNVSNKYLKIKIKVYYILHILI